MKTIQHLHIDIESKNWERLRGLRPRLEKACALTLACMPERLLPLAARAQMTLLLTTDKAVQTLNRDYRGFDKPTNVLSFPQFEPGQLVRQGKAIGAVYMGDIAVAYGVVVKESKAERKALLDHVTHLMIHGILHLFGYDHDTPAKARRMEKTEKEIMATLGLPDPYAVLDEEPVSNRVRRT